MGRAYRLAFAAAQAILDGIGDRADVRLLHDQGFVAQQFEARRVGAAQVASGMSLCLLNRPVGVDALLVGAEPGELLFGQVLELGDADAVFARDHAVEARARCA